MKHFILGLAASVSLFALPVPSAVAQDMASDVPVLGTPDKPAAKPVPAVDRFDYSLMALSLEGRAGMRYNDNIYRTDRNEESDLIASFAPKVTLGSNFARHELAFSAAGDFGRFLSENKNNYEDFDFRAKGVYDLSETNALSIDGLFSRDHIAIGGFEDDPTSTLVKPVVYNEKNVDLAFKGSQVLFHYQAVAEWHRYDYRNVARENGTLNIQDDRDRDEYIGVGKFGYEFIPTYVFYVKGVLNQRDYDTRIDSSLLYPRDSEGYEALFGVSRDIEGLPFAFDVNMGYMDQNYDASELEDVQAFAANLEALWRLTESDRLEFEAARLIKDSMLEGVSSALQTKVGAEYTHDYSPVLSFSGGVEYTHSDFQSNTALSGNDRLDHLYVAKLGSRYHFTETLSLDLDYNYRKRESDEALTDYDAHVVGFSVALEY